MSLIYLAGPMRGYPLYNFPAFDEAAAVLRSEGHDVVSPADLDRRAGVDEHTPETQVCVKTALLRDLPAVLGCDAVYVLPGWRQSRGVHAETTVARAAKIPVIDYVTREAVTDDTAALFAEAVRSVAHPKSQAFLATLAEAAELHARKSKDYGSDKDPFANVRASEDFGIPAWVGCLMRANDKMKRLQTFAKKGVLANESARDSLADNVVYFAIATVLFDEASERANA